MILKINKERTALLTDIEDFIIGYQAKEWVKNHIHLYDEFISDDAGLFKGLVKDYFEEQEEYYSLLLCEAGIYVTCYEIRFAVAKEKAFELFNTYDEAMAFYCEAAKILLKDNYSFKNYKEEINFEVLERMINQYKLDLKLIDNGNTNN